MGRGTQTGKQLGRKEGENMIGKDGGRRKIVVGSEGGLKAREQDGG